MARYGKLVAKEGSTDVFIISNVVDASSSLGSDYVLLPDSPGYGIGDEYNSSTEEFTSVPNFVEGSEYFIHENTISSQALLQESDWTVLPDVGLTAANLQEWKNYRAQLRAIRKNPSDDTIDQPPEKPLIIYED